MNLLSIVIIEYHSVKEIEECVSSLQKHINVNYEVIVSSNSCYGEKDKEKIKNLGPNVKWIFNDRNGGYAYAMNRGMKAAIGDYIVIMNSDCTLQDDIKPMIDFLSNHKEIGAIGPKILDKDGNIQDTARPYVTLPRFILRQTKRILTHKISILNPFFDYTKVQTVDWIIGAFIMVTRKAYDATNGLDDNFFMYAEDADWCTRIRQHGYEIIYYPKVIIRYKGTRRARSNKKYAKIFIKSHFYYWRKFGFFFGYPKRKKILFD